MITHVLAACFLSWASLGQAAGFVSQPAARPLAMPVTSAKLPLDQWEEIRNQAQKQLQGQAVQWQDLQNKIKDQGAYRVSDGANSLGDCYELTNISKNHLTANYLRIWGYPVEDNRFVATNVELTSTERTIVGKNRFRVERWIFVMGLDGTLEKVTHTYSGETFKGHLYAVGGNLPLNDAPAKLQALLLSWYEFQGSAHHPDLFLVN